MNVSLTPELERLVAEKVASGMPAARPSGHAVYGCLPASSCYYAYMGKMHSRQYTIRNVPDSVDRILRSRAKASRKSFNQVALEALIVGAGSLPVRRDLSGVAGTMSDREASAIEEEIRHQHLVDHELWK